NRRAQEIVAMIPEVVIRRVNVGRVPVGWETLAALHQWIAGETFGVVGNAHITHTSVTRHSYLTQIRSEVNANIGSFSAFCRFEDFVIQEVAVVNLTRYTGLSFRIPLRLNTLASRAPL